MRENEAQDRAVNEHGHVLVVSVPGSGKSHLIVRKTVKLVRDDPGAPIVLVTFTRDAADELLARLKRELGRLPRHVLVGTFHSLSIELLRRGGIKTRLLTPGEQRHLLWRAYRAAGDGMEWDEAITSVEKLKSVIDPVLKNAPGADIYRAYQTMLEEHGSMDFADLLLTSVRRMRAGALKPLPCRYLMVDEYQDTDPSQKAWMECHADAGAMATIVGDDDQSIYAFRSALGYKGMLDFEKKYNALRITLTINYRSGQKILTHADRLIRHNRERMNKVLIAFQDINDSALYRNFASRAEEVAAVLTAVHECPSNWAIIARTNRLLDQVEATMKGMDSPIAYKRKGSRSFWDIKHVTVYLSTLRMLHTGGTIGIEPLLMTAGIREADIARLRPISHEKLRTIDTLLPIDNQQQTRDLNARLNEWMEIAAADRTDLLIAAVASWHCGFLSKDNQKDVELAAATLGHLSGTLSSRLAKIERADKSRGTGGGVTLLTMHATKGLEFNCCWLVGIEEGNLPHSKTGSLAEEAEERRLCYVGMTRARKHLVLSTGDPKAVPSRFLTEAGFIPAAARTA